MTKVPEVNLKATPHRPNYFLIARIRRVSRPLPAVARDRFRWTDPRIDGGPREKSNGPARRAGSIRANLFRGQSHATKDNRSFGRLGAARRRADAGSCVRREKEATLIRINRLTRDLHRNRTRKIRFVINRLSTGHESTRARTCVSRFNARNAGQRRILRQRDTRSYIKDTRGVSSRFVTYK